jgi:prepilin-type N-terminal cleavage/methylation domain-containing protein
MLRSHRSALIRLYDQRGFTLIELLVAMIAGLVVSFAAFAVLNTSLSQSTRIADRTSADQRGRLAMEKIMLELHSSCVASEVTPVEPKSTENTLRIVSKTGAEAAFATVELHEISFTEKAGKGTLTDTSYTNTGEKPAPNWVFNLEKPVRTQTLLSGVTRSENSKKEAIPVFQYFKYEGSKLSETPLKGELEEKTAGEVAAITVSFTTAPESGTVGKVPGDRTVDLTDTAVLRFSPASSTETNLSCE